MPRSARPRSRRRTLVANAHALVDSIVKAKPSAAKGKYLKSVTVSSTMGPGVASIDSGSQRHRNSRQVQTLHGSHESRQEASSSGPGGGVPGSADAAILVDYKGINVPQVTELRRQLRAAKAQLQGGQEHAREAGAQGHRLRGRSSAHFEGTTAVAYTATDPVALAKTLTTFMKTAPALQIKAAVVQGRAIKPAEVTDLASAAGQAGAYAKLLFVLQAPMVQICQRAQRRAARSDDRAGAGGEEATEASDVGSPSVWADQRPTSD